jgi:GNAT superfamily N-acetyltransferase
MKARLADRWDIPQLLDLLRNYRSATPWARLRACDNEKYVTMLLTQCLFGGVIFVVEQNSKLIGMLIALRNSNIWDPELYVMNELAYWVEPEYRGGRAGYRLLKAYQEYCEQARQAGTIESYTISKMVNSPDLDYGRFGFSKLEEMWRI